MQPRCLQRLELERNDFMLRNEMQGAPIRVGAKLNVRNDYFHKKSVAKSISTLAKMRNFNPVALNHHSIG
eukprot:scaffold110334_cov22-Tisochrysis_lutea.AAC.1